MKKAKSPPRGGMAIAKVPAAGIRHDQGKARYDLVSFIALEELTKVYTMGASKYPQRNWELGMAYSRILAAIFRHIVKWVMGATIDKESGLHHLAHAAWGCFTLIHYDMTGMMSWDDMPMRIKQANKKVHPVHAYFSNFTETDQR